MTGDNPKLLSSTKPHILVIVSLALLLRTRIITGPRDLVHKLRHVGSSSELGPSELNQALQQLYVERPDGTRQLLVPSNNGISKARLVIFRPSFHSLLTRSHCILLPMPSSRLTSHTSRPSPPLRKTSPMSIAPFSANSSPSCALCSLHTAPPKSGSSSFTVPSLYCAPC
jgi:hypothetical protein